MRVNHHQYTNSFCFRFSKNMKKGAPHNEVKTPTGTSTGEKIVRERISMNIKKNAPPIALARISLRCDGPTSSRKMCGMIKPTKPMDPARATLAPTRSEEEKN